MNEFFIASIFAIVQIILSILLIIRQKNKIATISEIIVSLILLFSLNGHSIQISNKFWLYLSIVLIEYLSIKIFLVVFMLMARYCSFYLIKFACRSKKKVKRIKFKFVKLFSKVKYWPKLKLGIPGMAGKIHAKTKVRFDEKGFPEFKPIYKVKLKKQYWRETRESHFHMANSILNNSLKSNSRIKIKFSKEQIKQIAQGITPKGYTWHHHQDEGVLLLVDEKIHAKTYHIGGYTIWGGK